VLVMERLDHRGPHLPGTHDEDPHGGSLGQSEVHSGSPSMPTASATRLM
jgi:hypothetical protein